jgi:hypothetical protein
MIEVIPLAVPNLDWNALIQTSMRVLGRSPTRGLDAAEQRIGDYRAYVVALTDLLSPGVSPHFAMQIANEALDHLWYSVMVYASTDELLGLIQGANFRMMSAKTVGNLKLAILSGTLSEWRKSIVYYLRTKPESDSEVRRFYGTMIVFFEQLGLGELWMEFEKNLLSDGTFVLRQL